MLVAIVAAAFVGCSKDATSDIENVTSGNTVTVNFDASVEDETRATLTPNDGETAFAAAWEDNKDKIGIYAYAVDNSAKEYEKTNVKGTRTGNEFEATFTGAPAEIASAEYCAYYPYTTAAGTLIPFGSERTQIGNNYNSAYDIMISDKVNVDCEDGKSTTIGKDAAGNAIVFPMKRQTAIAYFHFTTSDANVESEKLASATLTVEGENSFIAAETVTPVYYGENRGTYTIEEGKGVKSIKITFDAATAPTAADFTAWFNVLPCTFDSMTLELETENYTAKILRNTGSTYEAGKLYKVSGNLTKWKKVIAPDGTVLWSENWGLFGANSTTFTSNYLISDYKYTGRSGYKKNATSVTCTTDNNVRATISSVTNCTDGHLWFNKSVDGTLTTSAIKLYGATNITFSHSQGTKGSQLTTSYSTDDGNTWTVLGSQSGPIATKTYKITVADGTESIKIKLYHPQSNAKNTRVDNLVLKVQ